MQTMQAMPNKRTLGLIGIVLLFLILLTFVVYKFLPLNSKISDQKDEMDRVQQQINILTNKMAEKNQANAEVSQDEVQSALPLYDNTEQLLMDLKAVGLATDVQMLNATFSLSDSNQLQSMLGGENTPYPTVHEVKTAVVLQGSYDQLLDWIAKLQQLPRIIVVDSFNLSKPVSETDRSKSISLSINVTAYFDPSYQGMVDHIESPFSN